MIKLMDCCGIERARLVFSQT